MAFKSSGQQIWFRKARRALPFFSAFWRRDFRLRLQFYPNPDYCSFHVSGKVTREMILTFTSSEKKTLLIGDLSRIKDVKRVILRHCEVMLEKESVSDWEEILPEVKKIIIQHLVKK